MSETLDPGGLPLILSRLRDATEDVERDAAWAEFVAAHSATVLHTCRTVARDHDAAMDAYAYALEALRENQCRRLRAYVPDGRTRFSTWLVVVTRRLVLDYLRRRYGRSRTEDETRRAEQASRRRLEDLIADVVEPEQLADSSVRAPDASIRREQVSSALRRAIDELDPSDRLLLSLRFVDETPVREIATILHLPSVFHVYRRLGVVLSTLRDDLLRRGIDSPEP